MTQFVEFISSENNYSLMSITWKNYLNLSSFGLRETVKNIFRMKTYVHRMGINYRNSGRQSKQSVSCKCTVQKQPATENCFPALV